MVHCVYCRSVYNCCAQILVVFQYNFALFRLKPYTEQNLKFMCSDVSYQFFRAIIQ